MLNNDKISSLIDRAKNIKKTMILTKSEIDHVSRELSVVFSDDFYTINSCFRYDNLHFDFYCFYFKECNQVAEETIDFRTKYKLPHKYVVLSDMGDGGYILIETQESRDKPSPVIWCDYEDFLNLCEEGKFKYNPTIWPSFTDFFEYLVEQEEAKLKE